MRSHLVTLPQALGDLRRVPVDSLDLGPGFPITETASASHAQN